MRRLRLRWRLAFSHAALAVVLVAIAGNRIEAQSRVADHERAVAVAERDADVLAARASRVFGRTPLVTDLVGDEQVGSRQAEVVDPDLSRVAGDDLVGSAGALTAAARVLADGTPSTVALGTRSVVAASPIVSDSVLVGVAMVAEVVPSSVPGLASFGVSNWLGAFLILVAAGAGWLLAGALSRPIAELTDDARGLALGTVVGDRTRAALPEVDTLSAAIQGIAGRRHRGDELATEQNESLRALSHRLSHQLRTPLAILRLRVDDLADPELPADQRELVGEVVNGQIERLDRLGEELAELDPARWQLKTVPLDLVPLVRRVFERNVPLASWGGVAMSSHLGADALLVDVDPILIEDAVSNIVHNAIKYTPRGGRIDVSVSHTDVEAMIVITDTGPGFHPSERDNVLRAGVRGAASGTAHGTGHGLGLVADAMTRHRGRIELGASPAGGVAPGGALVRMVLPLVPAAAASGRPPTPMTTLGSVEQQHDPSSTA